MNNNKNTITSYSYFYPELNPSKLDWDLSQILKNYSPNQIFLNIRCAAKYLCFSKSALDSWRCTKRHPLPYHKEGKDIHYLLSDLNTFIENHASQPLKNKHQYKSLLNRKSAAKQINSTSGTLAVWLTQKNPNLTYIKIGRSIRYRPSDLSAFNLERLRTPRVSRLAA